ncbi:MAG: TRAP transporter substrate-binding protein [Planctomycetota bacterium]|jgi:C4-dicarboxylate-binding protein DctP|nr:TRAP transporter substrate-binding protein [Planctomycetota bacterium]
MGRDAKANFILLILVLAAGAAACYGPATAAEKTFRLSWAPAWDEQHGLTQAGIQSNEKIKELSGGKIAFEFFPGGQLGNEREVFESVQLGTIDLAFMSSPVVSGFSDVLDGFDMPYLCDNDMELYQEIVNSGIGDIMFEKLRKETGVIGLSYLINPGRDFYLNTVFNTLADAKGVKLRSMESPLHIATYKALGFNPTPMAYGEIYQAMKNGTIDGFEDVSVSVRAQKNYEVAKQVVISGHMTAAPVFIMSRRAWGQLDERERAWMREAGIAAQEATKVTYMEQTPLTIEFMKKYGLRIGRIEMSEAKKLVQPVIREFCDKSENIMTIINYFNDYRAKHGK